MFTKSIMNMYIYHAPLVFPSFFQLLGNAKGDSFLIEALGGKSP